MKTLLSKIIFFGFAAALVGACEKEEVKAVIKSPSAVVVDVSASATTIVLDSASAASTTAVTFSWNAADYGAPLAVAYMFQVDSASGTFAKPVEVNMGNTLKQSYTKKALNDLALSLGLVPGEAGQIKVRTISDVSPVVDKVASNVITLTITPYSTKPTPKFPVPDNLFLVGDATPGGAATGWDNPVPVPLQQFTKTDDYTFALVIQLHGGASYLALPKNGDWAHKYAVVGSQVAAGGPFEPDAANNIPGPAADGLYKIVMDFVKGTYTLTPLAANPIPANLYIVGDATPGGSAHGWDNPVPVPSQQFTQLSNGEFKITIALSNTGSYLFLPLNGDWGHKYGGASASGGALLADGNVPNSNTPPPAAAGDYTIYVNFFSQVYKVTP